MDFDALNKLLDQARANPQPQAKQARKLFFLYTANVVEGRRALRNVLQHTVTWTREEEAQRVMHFLGCFCFNSGETLLQDKKESVSVWLLKEALRGTVARDSKVRLRMTVLSGSILQYFAEAVEEGAEFCRESLREFAKEQLMERCADNAIAVRVAALDALASLQNESGVMSHYIDGMEDASPMVRRNALNHVDLTKHEGDEILLQAVLSRLEDTDDAARHLAFKRVIVLRLEVLDESHMVLLMKHAIKREQCWPLMRKWVASCEGDWVIMLGHVNVVENEELVAEVLQQCTGDMGFQRGYFKGYVDELLPETALLWRVYLQWPEVNFERHAPDLKVFASFLEEYSGEPFQLRQLLMIVASYDMSDEAGRREMTRCLRELVVDSRVHESCLQAWITALRATLTEEKDLVQVVLECISELRTVPAPGDRGGFLKSAFVLGVRLASVLLVETHESLRNAGLSDLLQKLILPCVQSEDSAYRVEGFRALAPYCLLSRDYAQRFLVMFIQALEVDNSEEVQDIALGALLDLSCVFSFGLVQGSAAWVPLVDRIVPEDQASKNRQPLVRYFLYLINTLAGKELRAKLIMGLWKVIYHTRVQSDVLCGRLLLELEFNRMSRSKRMQEMAQRVDRVLLEFPEEPTGTAFGLLMAAIPEALRQACVEQSGAALCEAIDKTTFSLLPTKQHLNLTTNVCYGLLQMLLLNPRGEHAPSMLVALNALKVPKKPSKTSRQLGELLAEPLEKLLSLKLPAPLQASVWRVALGFDAVPKNYRAPMSVKAVLDKMPRYTTPSPRRKRAAPLALGPTTPKTDVKELAQKRKKSKNKKTPTPAKPPAVIVLDDEEDEEKEAAPPKVKRTKVKASKVAQVAFEPRVQQVGRRHEPQILAMGATPYFKNKWSSLTTHFVCGKDQRHNSIMSLAARVGGAWMLDEQWLEDSIRDGEWQDEAGYSWAPHGKFMLFSGKKVFVDESFAQDAGLKKSHLEKVLSLAGAKIVKRSIAHYVLVSQENKSPGETNLTWQALMKRMFSL